MNTDFGNNILDAPMFSPYHSGKKRTPVTIIAGLICKDAIVLASDSQTSFGNSKRTDSEKISIICFKNNRRVLVAQSGNAELSSRAVELFKDAANGNEFDSFRKPTDLLEDALKHLKQEVIRLNLWENNRDFAHEFFKDLDNNFSLMLAYYYGEKQEPYIYTVQFWPGIASRQHNYATLGCGSTVAEFILGQAEVQTMDYGNGIMTAIYTVEEVKKVDALCGGQTKVAIVRPDGSVALPVGRRITMVDAAVKSFEASKQNRQKEWRNMLDEIASDAFALFKDENQKKNKTNE